MTAGEATVARARLLLELSRPGDAVPLLQRAVASDPGSAEAWLLLASAELARAAPAEALAAVGQAAVLAPHAAAVHVLASAALSALDRHDEAVAAARTGVRADPDDPAPHCALARALLRTPRGGREAWAAAAHATRLAPDEPEPHAVMGAVALVTRHHDVAEAAFRRVLTLRPEDADARVGLGLVAAAVGNDAAAARELTSALATDPTSSGSRQVLEALWARALLLAVGGVGGVDVALVVVAGPALRSGAEVSRAVLAGPALLAVVLLVLHVLRVRGWTPPAARPAVRQWLRHDRGARVRLACTVTAGLPLLAAFLLPAPVVALLAAAGAVVALAVVGAAALAGH